MNKRTLIVLVSIVALGAVVFRSQVRDAYIEWSKPPVPSEQPRPTLMMSPSTVVSPRTSKKPSPSVSSPVSGAINLAVPFSSQAPEGDWSLPWQEACEETSAILVGAYWNGKEPTVESMKEQIWAAVDWQNNTFGYYKHTTAAQTAQLVKAMYGFQRVEVEYNVGTDAIAKHVRAGRPVIVPLAGRELGNPYYTSPGPVYHMLVVKGIAENGDIITNDVGTRHGKNMTYSPTVFQAAMHDVPAGGDEWPVGVDPVSYIDSGQSAIIVVYPN